MIDKLKRMVSGPAKPPPLPPGVARAPKPSLQPFGEPLEPMEEAILEKQFGQLSAQAFVERFLNSHCLVLTTKEHLTVMDEKPALGATPVLFTITYPDMGTTLAMFTHPSRISAGGDQVKPFPFGVRCSVGRDAWQLEACPRRGPESIHGVQFHLVRATDGTHPSIDGPRGRVTLMGGRLDGWILGFLDNLAERRSKAVLIQVKRRGPMVSVVLRARARTLAISPRHRRTNHRMPSFDPSEDDEKGTKEKHDSATGSHQMRDPSH